MKGFDKSLLHKWLSGHASPQEQQTITELLKKADPFDIKDTLEQDWQEATETMPALAADKVLQSALQAISRKTAEVIPVRKKWWAHTAVAASLIGFLTAGILLSLYFYRYSTEKQVLAWRQVVNNKNNKVICTLPDSSRIWLSPHTEISYSFDDRQRRVQLRGEAFFAVQKDASHPFEVQANGLTVTVLGTRFNVESWRGENQVRVALVEGSVKAGYLDKERKAGSLLMTPGTMITYHTDSGAARMEPVNQAMEADWISPHIVLHQLPLETALKRVCRVYGKVPVLKIDKRQKGLFSSVLPGNDLRNALDNLAFVYRLQYTIQKDTVTITAP